MNVMKKSIVLSASFVIIASIVWMVILSNRKPLETDVPLAADSSSQPASIVYTVKDYGGKVAVFKDGVELQEVFDTLVSGLPEMDQESLQDGIMVYSQKELDRLIEDLTS